jgi:uncharacterized integral membrane protein
MSMETTEDTSEEKPRRTRTLVHDTRLVVGTLILAALVAFALDNRRATHINWIVGNGNQPLAVLLAAAAVAGALIGWLFLHRPHRQA